MGLLDLGKQAAKPTLYPKKLLQGVESEMQKGPHAQRQRREMLTADLAKLRGDPDALGLSEAQRTTMIGQAAQQAGAQAQGQASLLGRDALGAQGFQAGAFAEGASELTDAGDNAAVKATTDVNALHRNLVQTEKARIMGDMDEEAQRQKDNQMFWAKMGINVAGAIASIWMGPAGPAAAGAITSSMDKSAAPAAPSAAPPPQATLLPTGG